MACPDAAAYYRRAPSTTLWQPSAAAGDSQSSAATLWQPSAAAGDSQSSAATPAGPFIARDDLGSTAEASSSGDETLARGLAVDYPGTFNTPTRGNASIRSTNTGSVDGLFGHSQQQDVHRFDASPRSIRHTTIISGRGGEEQLRRQEQLLASGALEHTRPPLSMAFADLQQKYAKVEAQLMAHGEVAVAQEAVQAQFAADVRAELNAYRRRLDRAEWCAEENKVRAASAEQLALHLANTISQHVLPQVDELQLRLSEVAQHAACEVQAVTNCVTNLTTRVDDLMASIAGLREALRLRDSTRPLQPCRLLHMPNFANATCARLAAAAAATSAAALLTCAPCSAPTPRNPRQHPRAPSLARQRRTSQAARHHRRSRLPSPSTHTHLSRIATHLWSPRLSLFAAATSPQPPGAAACWTCSSLTRARSSTARHVKPASRIASTTALNSSLRSGASRTYSTARRRRWMHGQHCGKGAMDARERDLDAQQRALEQAQSQLSRARADADYDANSYSAPGRSSHAGGARRAAPGAGASGSGGGGSGGGGGGSGGGGDGGGGGGGLSASSSGTGGACAGDFFCAQRARCGPRRVGACGVILFYAQHTSPTCDTSSHTQPST
ncbi:hypothetical protein JKP88DRAFT_248372 [Tribonema minus]|uniref:Uncharacterized protein n=1 Tax=Tribonema minus TaxID=303371 RepID=A0A835YMH7_9STRA|nr:hypothetical protein JKP88DRAFT_248372 [Tribonema minus]